MDWTNYWVLYNTQTLVILRRWQHKEDADKGLKKFYKSFSHIKNINGLFKIDNISGITEKQWGTWRKLQYEKIFFYK